MCSQKRRIHFYDYGALISAEGRGSNQSGYRSKRGPDVNQGIIKKLIITSGRTAQYQLPHRKRRGVESEYKRRLRALRESGLRPVGIGRHLRGGLGHIRTL